MEHEVVDPVRPVAPYQGGKNRLAKTLTARIEATPHELYAEVFVGMGGVFFRRTRRPKAEVINDYSRDVATLFRILNRHYTAFIDMLRYQLTSRADFIRLVETRPDLLTDLERSARFLYLQRAGFGGKVNKRSFGVSMDRPARFDLSKIEVMLQDVHERLTGVTIECLDWRDFLTRYDRPATLFYLDPPYYGCEDDYGKELFSRDDFIDMAKALGALKGRFILSLNDRPEVREIFRGFEIEAVETTYSVGGGKNSKKVGEVIISKGL